MIIDTRDGIVCAYIVVWGKGVGVSLHICNNGHCVKVFICTVSGTNDLHRRSDSPYRWPTSDVISVPLCWRSDVAVAFGPNCCVRPFCGDWHICGGGVKCG